MGEIRADQPRLVARTTIHGLVPEWLGSGLQSRLCRFESGRGLRCCPLWNPLTGGALGLRPDSYPDHAGIVARTRYLWLLEEAVMENIVERTVRVVEINEPNMSYEVNEFQVRKDPETGLFWAGHDSGCSCYEGFNPANFAPCNTVGGVRALFQNWMATTWRDGWGREAAAWEAFNEAVR